MRAMRVTPLRQLLLVDTDPKVRAQFATAAAELRLRLRVAGSADEAWQLLKADPPCVLFSEYHLPAVDGFQFLDQVGAWSPAVLRILHTDARFRAVPTGLDVPVLGKPCDALTLRDLLASLSDVPAPTSSVRHLKLYA